MQEVCHGCRKNVSQSERRDILAEDRSIEIYEKPESPKSSNDSKHITLSNAIELITGANIDKTTERFVNLCTACFEKVESYVNFRAQLLASFGKSTTVDQTTESPFDRAVPLPLENSPSTTDTEDEINVDEDNGSLELNLISSSTDEADANDSIRDAKLRNDQENNNLYDSEISNDSADLAMPKAVFPKIQENDIELEIDVCSGEDDEVLELDSQCKTSNPVELESSSESDLEVCDYEPIGKRIKNYNSLSCMLLARSM